MLLTRRSVGLASRAELHSCLQLGRRAVAAANHISIVRIERTEKALLNSYTAYPRYVFRAAGARAEAPAALQASRVHTTTPLHACLHVLCVPCGAGENGA